MNDSITVKPRRRVGKIAAAAIVVALIAFVLIPPRHANIFRYLPVNAIAYGYHGDLRATWKDQLKDPAVAALLAGWGEDANKACRESGAFWTFLLAVGEDAASALLQDDVGQYSIAAASPMGRRNLLLRFFWFIRWVPGLGRIHTDQYGIRYIDLTDDDEDGEEKPTPLILSVALGKGVLLAKLSDRPVSLADMFVAAEHGDGAVLAEKLTCNLPEGFRHRIVVMPAEIEKPEIRLDREVSINLAQSCGRTELTADFPVFGGDGTLRELLAEKVGGRNSTASALAASHAFALVLLPSRFAAKQARSLLRLGKGAASGEDAVLYLTSGQYGAQLFVFAIPALTVSIPGITLDSSMLAPLLKALPKQMRKTCAIHGKDTFCSSSASLRQQTHAAPPPPYTWQNGFLAFAKSGPSAFLHLDFDVFAAELRQIAQAVAMAASFAQGDIDPAVLQWARMASEALPRFPTGLRFAAALTGDGDCCTISASLSVP